MELNPNRTHRIARERIASFQQCATARVEVAAALALAAAPQPELLLNYVMTLDYNRAGESDPVFLVEATGGPRYAIVDHSGLAVYECKVVAGPYQTISESDVGPVVGRVEGEYIEAFLSAVKGRPIGAVAELLVRQARPQSKVVKLAAAGPFESIGWVERLMTPELAKPSFHVLIDDELFLLTESKRGFVLSSKVSAQTYGPVDEAEAAQHAASVGSDDA